MIDPLNKLCKWRMVLAGWMFGSKSIDTPGCQGQRDLIDKLLVLRVESNAVAGLLIKKGVFSAKEYTEAVHQEAAVLDKVYEGLFLGFHTSENGIILYDQALAQQTMTRLGFPE